MTPSFAKILFKLKDLEFEFSSSFLSSAVTLDVVFLHGGDHTLVGGEGGAGDVKKIGLKPKNVKGKKIESIIELSVHLKCL
jgi:hypothetical protein